MAVKTNFKDAQALIKKCVDENLMARKRISAESRTHLAHNFLTKIYGLKDEDRTALYQWCQDYATNWKRL